MLYGTSDISQLSSIQNISQALQDMLVGTPFANISIARNPQDGKPFWRWTPDGIFSSASAYKLLTDVGIRSPILAFAWKIKAPTKVKIFIWLLLKNRLLTQANLLKRNWPSIPNCILCSTLVTEDARHLFVDCNFANATWLHIIGMIRLNNFVWQDNIIDFWQKNRHSINKSKPILWDSIWTAGCWCIWKERNSRIFNNNFSTPARIAQNTIMLARHWFTNC